MGASAAPTFVTPCPVIKTLESIQTVWYTWTFPLTRSLIVASLYKEAFELCRLNRRGSSAEQMEEKHYRDEA